MELNEYIASGILESYVLGTASAQEKKEVECMSHIYPEIRMELDRIAMSMEQLAMAQRVSAPAQLKRKVMEELSRLETASYKEANVVPLTQRTDNSRTYKWLAAAAVLAAFFAVGLYFNESNNMIELNKQYVEAQNTIEEKDVVIGQLQRDRKYTSSELAMFRNPNFKTVFLKATPNKPENSMAIVCWNQQSKEVLVAVESLPSAPSDKQYQLWAIVDGKPVDMGMLPMDTSNPDFISLKNVENPQAFAITLEKVGGNPTPTLEEMVVLGTI